VDLLGRLLKVSPVSRLQFGTKVRAHSFFSTVNFEEVYCKSVTAPIIPPIERKPEESSDNLHSAVDPSLSLNENDIFQDF